MYNDHEFNPLTPEEEAERERNAEIDRRVRREVRRIRRGEADDDMRADEEAEAAEREAQEEALRREHRRKSSTSWQIFSGTILGEGVAKYYPYLLTVAGMFFLSIAVMFWSLHLDMKFSRMEREVKMLRERSMRLEEQRFRRTTHSAIVERLRERGIDLRDPSAPGAAIDN